ncbi:serine/threonine protein kinase [Pirellulaceae bacterium]|nr:serine/threonine protein kinase [Pirellulaceae bacterium]
MKGTRIGPFSVHDKLGPHKRHHVYRATQTEQHRDVALKFIKVPPDVPPAKAISRIQRETKILKQLNHPNLVKVHGAGMENGNIFFALELVDGEPLSAILSRRSKLNWEQASDYARQIACCLEYLHSQEMVHLKLTPDKILITPDGQVKVTDLRLNRSKKKRWDSVRKKSMDIAAYLPPEQFAGEKGTAKSDFYSLGIILFEMLTGKIPYTADSFATLAKQKGIKRAPLISEFTLECPMWMEKVVASLLEIDPAKRPFSARAVIVALDDVRRADRDGTGFAEKMVSGFSPLTAGKDKTEAKKALGLKSKKRPKDDVPIFQSTTFLVSSLAIIVVIMASLIFFLRPESPEQLFQRAEQEYKDGNLNRARVTLRDLIKRGDTEFLADAEDMYVGIRAESLVQRAMNRPTIAFDLPGPTMKFYRAFEHELNKRYDEAIESYDEVLTTVSYDNLEERHIFNVATAQKKAIKAKKNSEQQKEKPSKPQKEIDEQNKNKSQTVIPQTNEDDTDTNPKQGGQSNPKDKTSGKIPS